MKVKFRLSHLLNNVSYTNLEACFLTRDFNLNLDLSFNRALNLNINQYLNRNAVKKNYVAIRSTKWR